MWNKKLMGLVGVFGAVLMLSACNGTDSVTDNNNNSSDDTTACVVGTVGPAGGYIFFCDDADNKLLASDKVGLESAPSDLSNTYIWSDVTDVSAGTLIGIGTGAANTQAIIAQSPTADTAAKACNNLVVGSYDDFFLPSRNELNTMYVNLRMQDLFGTVHYEDVYWSSSDIDDEFSPNQAWGQDFYSGLPSDPFKDSVLASVRCVRAF